MFRSTVNPNFNTHLSQTGTAFFLPVFNNPFLRYFMALLSFAVILLVSTSYLRSPKNPNDMGIEYLTPSGIDSLRNTLEHYAAANEPVIRGEKMLVFESVRNFYRQVDNKPVWTHARGLSRRADNMLELIDRAREFGLEPSHYHIAALKTLQADMLHHTL